MNPAWKKKKKTGKVYRYNQLVLFAINGLICIIDERPGIKEGEHTMLTCKDLEERVRAMNIAYRGQTRVDQPRRNQELYDIRLRGSQDCMECIKEAKAQGDPNEPKVQAYWRRHKSNFRTIVSFSKAADPENYPELPPLDLGSITGRTSDVDANLMTAARDPFDTVPLLYKPPTRKNRSGIVLLND